MSAVAAGGVPTPSQADVDVVLGEEVRPALGSHAGSIEVSSVNEGHIFLRFLGSCQACYFRRGCVANFVVPSMRTRFGEDISVTVTNAR